MSGSDWAVSPGLGARWEAALSRFVAPPALLLFAFGAFYDVGLGNTGLGILLFALLAAVPVRGRDLARDPMVWLTLAFVGMVLIHAWLYTQARPDWAYEIWSAAGDWLLTPLLGSLVIAFWIAHRPRLLPWMLVLLVVGYLVRIGEQATVEEIDRLLRGKGRATFGDAATNFGIWSLLIVLVLMSLLPVALRLGGVALRALALVLWAGALLVAVAGLILSQARGSWLAALVAVPLMLFLQLRPCFHGRHPAALAAAVATVTVVCLLLVWVSFDTVLERRLDDHRQTIVRILSGELQDLPSDSPGYRIRMYREALETWWQRPVLGLGPAASEIALAEGEDEGIRRFSRTHNSYLVVLQELGLVGLGMLAGFVVVLIRRARHARRDRWLSHSQAQLLVAALTAFAIAQLFEHSLHSYRGPYVIALLCGMAWSYRFVERERPAQW